MKRFHGIYWQQFGLTAGMVLLTLLLLGTSFFTLTYTYIMREKQNELVQKAELMAQVRELLSELKYLGVDQRELEALIKEESGHD